MSKRKMRQEKANKLAAALKVLLYRHQFDETWDGKYVCIWCGIGWNNEKITAICPARENSGLYAKWTQERPKD